MKRATKQTTMFQSEDLPLFSGTAQRVKVEGFRPQLAARQLQFEEVTQDHVERFELYDPIRGEVTSEADWTASEAQARNSKFRGLGISIRWRRKRVVVEMWT